MAAKIREAAEAAIRPTPKDLFGEQNPADFILLMLAAFSAVLYGQEGAERGTSRRMQCSMTERKNFQVRLLPIIMARFNS